MKVIVTGGSGLIGSRTVLALVADGHEVVNIDRRPSNTGTRHYALDIADVAAVKEVFMREQPEAVMHLAAQISVPVSVRDPIGDMRDNIQGSLAVFEAARHSGVRRVVVASSAAVYGDAAVPPIAEDVPLLPQSPYGVAKVAMEQYVSGFYQEYFSYGILRYGNVYGPEQRHQTGAVIAKLAYDAATTGRVRMDGDGTQQRDFVHVDDIGMLNVLALKSTENWVINIGTGKPVQIRDLVDMITQILQKQVEIDFAPTRPGDIYASYYNVEKMRRILHWEPKTSLYQGLIQVVESVQQP